MAWSTWIQSPFSWLTLALFMVGCPGTQEPISGPDAGVPFADAGALNSDGGLRPVDGGSAVVDAGASLPDAGPGTADAGSFVQGDEPLPPQVSEHHLEQRVNGELVSRRFQIRAPRQVDANRRYPVVIAFHGKGGRGDMFLGPTRPFVDDGRFVAVLPDGIDRGWNLGFESPEPDDLVYVDLLMAELHRYGALDFTRVYALGFSNGAGQVQRLAAQRSYFRAHAAVATALIEGGEPQAGVHPASFLSIHGVDDPVCPYGGGPGAVRLDFIHAETSAALWAEQLGCPERPEQSTTPAGNRRFLYSPCDGGHRVLHYGIEGVGHSVPRDTEGGLYDLIVEFFETSP